MDAWVQRHQPLIFSTLYMLFAVLVAGYSLLYSSKSVYLRDLSMVSGSVQTVNAEMKKRVDASRKQEQEAAAAGIRYLPVFMARINEIAHNNEVIIRKLAPDKEGTLLKFRLDFIADYPTFVRFTAELESLDILLDDIQVHPHDLTKTPPLHNISFTLIPQNNAEPIAGQRLDELKKWVFAKDKRDPFQRFAYDTSRKVVNASIDLTWVYKLEGLGQTPGSGSYANINRKSYHVGDDLDGREITKIGADRVYLQKKGRDGITEYTLSFRKINKQEQKGDKSNKKK